MVSAHPGCWPGRRRRTLMESDMQKFWVVLSEEAATEMLGTPLAENKEWLSFKTSFKYPVDFYMSTDDALEKARQYYQHDKQYSVIAQVTMDDKSVAEALTAVQFGSNTLPLKGKCLEHFWFPARK